MKFTLEVSRYHPDKGDYKSKYELEATKNTTVLDALLHVRDNIDGTLGLRCSCRCAICGSCAMMINKYSKLACNTHVIPELEKYGNTLYVDPPGNMKPIKDLVVDTRPFWAHMRNMKPWLIKDPKKPIPAMEHYMTREEVKNFLGTPNCILCGACHSACPAVEVDEDFPGPAALARSYRYAKDPRDDARKSRLDEISKIGLWWCVRCYLCVEACPKDVRPGEVITHLRELTVREGAVDDIGAKHAIAFTENIREHGNLDEFDLAKDTLGFANFIKQIPRPTTVLMGMRGKAPFPIKPIPKTEEVKKIYSELEGE